MSLNIDEKKQVMSEYQQKEGDTGSCEVQIALLTVNINKLTEHFKVHQKDNHSRRGMIRMVNLRRKLLRYLKDSDIERYRSIISRLGLRG